MFREINDGDRTGYTIKDGKKVGTINVCGTAQIIGECKFIEIDTDTKRVKSIRKELPKKKVEAKAKKKTETKESK